MKSTTIRSESPPLKSERTNVLTGAGVGQKLNNNFNFLACKGGIGMPTKKKTSKATDKKEKGLEKEIEIMEEKLKRIEEAQQIEAKIGENKEAIREDLKNQLMSQNKFGKQCS